MPAARSIPTLMAIRRGGKRPELEAWLDALAENAVAEGVDAVQIRDKSAPDRDLYELARLARARLPLEIAVLVNRRPDIALAAGCDGVHLPADGLPTREVRRAFGEALLIGRSTHSRTEVEHARRDGADYVLFGPVYATPEKLRYGPPQGLDGLRRACELAIPVLAVGGIDRDRLAEVLEAGAQGAAAIRLFERARALEPPVGVHHG